MQSKHASQITESSGKDELKTISAELDDLRKEMPELNVTNQDSRNDNSIVEKPQQVSLGADTSASIMSSTASVVPDSSSDTLKIQDDDVAIDAGLEIMNLDQIDNIEPDISLDIEELK